ncbi:hypothetical protein CC1G_14453 [Coprinopsis cinerea okayama7|uniref:Uncharacterized protein n=1 Tax=Coprinopsis cinerea (strain Okayama-7 / 130 / ATCC MYA-4618 / FGSC 9003) TaxID=240176 RepID=D6RLU7_COPC7|nr:hypothetical protein CC1G_14453 [Coprinopsis cinerea okayama7\|eukprot:XP_002911455.1 hypothetical protein CC1G_14453 [Coprinopsis cinerea okayama7\
MKKPFAGCKPTQRYPCQLGELGTPSAGYTGRAHEFEISCSLSWATFPALSRAAEANESDTQHAVCQRAALIPNTLVVGFKGESLWEGDRRCDGLGRRVVVVQISDNVGNSMDIIYQVGRRNAPFVIWSATARMKCPVSVTHALSELKVYVTGTRPRCR